MGWLWKGDDTLLNPLRAALGMKTKPIPVPVPVPPLNAELEALRQQYIAWSRQVGSCDRVAAERAVVAAYKAMDMPAPKFLWFASPPEAMEVSSVWELLESVFAIAAFDDQKRLVFSLEALEQSLNHSSRFLQEQFLGAADRTHKGNLRRVRQDRDFVEAYHDQLFSAVSEPTWEDSTTSRPLEAWVEAWQRSIPTLESVDDQAGIRWQQFRECVLALSDSEQARLLESCCRQLQVISLDWAFFRLAFRFGSGDALRCFMFEMESYEDGPNPVLLAMRETVRECGWWLPTEKICFMVDRPNELHLDTNNQLHRFDGKAVEFADGFGIYALHGIVVPEHIVYGRFTCEDIESAKNLEWRRLMIDRFGADKYLQTTGAKELHKDQCGVLYLKEVPGDEPVVMVKVINSTAEPDGSFKEYFLRVPPNTRTAREGIAWTFGMSEYEYKPGLET